MAPVVTSSHAATSAPTERPAAIETVNVDSIAVVVTNDLPVRSKPGTGTDSELRSPTLNAGQDVFVLAGPVAASGSMWYEVDPSMGAGTYVNADDPPSGWVAAASRDGVPWLLPKRDVCADRDLPEEFWELGDLPPVVALACFGGRPMTFEAKFGGYETCGLPTWTIDPRWLGDPCSVSYAWLGDPMVEDHTGLGDQITAAFAPGADASRLHPGTGPRGWVTVKVTGQFDHPAARTCQGVSGEQEVPLDPDAIVLACRAQFVITSIDLVK